MRRRTLLLGAGTAIAASASITATSAGLAEDISIDAVFSFEVDEDPTIVDIEANPDSEEAASRHTWEFSDVPLEEDLEEIAVTYPDGASVVGVGDDDVRVWLTQAGDDDQTEVGVRGVDTTELSATIELDTRGQRDTSVDGPATVEIDGVQNPEEDVYQAEMTFDDGAETISATGELVITEGSPFFSVDITDAPDQVGKDETLTIEYTVENTGEDPGGQDVTVTVNDTEEESEFIDLDVGDSVTRTYTEVTDGSRSTLEILIESQDTDDDTVVVVADEWDLELDPEQQNRTSDHTWSSSFIGFDGEVRTVEISYPDRVDTADVTVDGITVWMERSEDDSLTEIPVTDATIGSSSVVIELDEESDSEPAGEVEILLEDVENPQPGEYEAAIELSGDRDDISFSIDFSV